jgi:hypothetical protein
MKIPPLPKFEDNEPSTSADFVAKPCWRCNAGPNRPSLDEHVAVLVNTHQCCTPVYWLRDDEARRLRGLLQPGDVIALLRNVHQIVNAMYGGVAVFRDELIPIDRRELQEA